MLFSWRPSVETELRRKFPDVSWDTRQVWQSPAVPWDLCDHERQARLRTAWNAGDLRYKLHPGQRQVYEDIFRSHATVTSSMERVYGLDISRQWGKDFLMSAIGVGIALRRRKQTRIPYAAPTKDMLKEIIVPTMMDLFTDCPPELLPIEISKGTFTRSADTLTWPWGARIVLVGVDLHPDRLRGPATYAFLFTECAFTVNLVDLMDGVIMPQLLTVPEGFGIMASTPPVTPAHAWTTRYLPEMKARGMYAQKVITDNPRLSEEQITAAIRSLGGFDSSRVRRELLCEHIVESSAVVIPEFTDTNIVPDSTPLPVYRDCYASLDPGMIHASGALFAYYDFEGDRLVIEGDFVGHGKNSRALSVLIRAREWQLWGVEPKQPASMTDKAWETELGLIRAAFYPNLEPPPPVLSFRNGQLRRAPYMRFSDTDSRLIADLSTEHGLIFLPAGKDDLEAAINSARLRIQEGKIVFKARAVNAINHTKNALWNRQRNRFAECPDKSHSDCLAALIYLNRMIPWGRNPVPPMTYDGRTHHIPKKMGPTSATARTLSRIFRGRS